MLGMQRLQFCVRSVLVLIALCLGLGSVEVPKAAAMTSVTLTVQPQRGNDDAEEAPNGQVNRSSSDLELVEDVDAGIVQQVGIRFPSVDIPQGATIDTAQLIFTVDEVSTVPTTLEIRAQASDTAGVFRNQSFNISSRPTTAASIAWPDIPPWPTIDVEKTSPDVSSIIQEVINRPGWQSGNALAVLLSGSGRRAAISYNNAASQAARLVVQYTIPDGPNLPPVVSNPGDQTNTEGDSIVLPIVGSDPNGDPLSYSTVGLPVGLSIDSISGVISGIVSTPGSSNVTITVSDRSVSDNVTFVWTVLVDDPSSQTITVQPLSGNDDAEEDQFGNMYRTSSDLELIEDIDGGFVQLVGIRFPNVNIPQAATILDAQLVFTVDVDVTFTWTVLEDTPTNDPPLVTNPGDQTYRVGESVNLPLIATDPENDPLIYAASGLPDGLAINTTTGVIAGTLTTVGSFSVTVTVSDGVNNPSVTFSWTVLSDDPNAQTVILQLGNNNDDGEEAPGGSVNLTSSDLELTEDTGVNQIVGMRFPNAALPQGATILDAQLIFTVDEVSTEATTVEIRAQASDTAAPITSATFNLSNRPLIGASVAWANIPTWPTINVEQVSPDVGTIVQEVVNRSGWQTGNALAVLISGKGGVPPFTRLVVQSCEGLAR
jgi:hypothetical protein